MKKHIIKLSSEERQELTALTRRHRIDARKKLRAQVLLACDQGPQGSAEIDEQIAARLPITTRSIESLRAWACEAGPIGALSPRPANRVYERKLDGRGEAQLVALACSKAPDGREHWSLQLLADELVTLAVVDGISSETVRRTLKKTNLSLI
jgi:hypothetical protein